MSVRRRRQCLKCGFRWNTYELRLTQGADSIDDVIFGSMTELQKLFEVLNTHYRGERKGGSPRTAD